MASRPVTVESDGRQLALPSFVSPVTKDSPPWIAPAIITRGTVLTPDNEPTARITAGDHIRPPDGDQSLPEDDEPSATIVLPLAMPKPPDRRSENGKR
jgi:hypothetical protein